MKIKQIHKSILAIILCIAFLWTGKKFIWNQEPALTIEAGDHQSSVTEMQPGSTTTPTQPQVSDPPGQTSSTTASIPDVTVTDQTGMQTDSSDIPGSENIISSSSETVSTTTTSTTAPPTPAVNELTAAPEGYFSDALFIGDSRTVGLANFAPIEGATYFATVGLDTYKLNSAISEVESTKGKNFDTVLYAQKYGKIYIMLGINELGYDRATTQQNFKNLVERVKTVQPGAIIYIEANLHVSYNRASRDSIVNNVQINEYNAYLASLADNDTVFYLDINPLFDDADGYLTAEYTSDGVHPYAKHYPTWVDWLKAHVIVK